MVQGLRSTVGGADSIPGEKLRSQKPCCAVKNTKTLEQLKQYEKKIHPKLPGKTVLSESFSIIIHRVLTGA